jgi:hypothetical protein
MVGVREYDERKRLGRTDVYWSGGHVEFLPRALALGMRSAKSALSGGRGASLGFSCVIRSSRPTSGAAFRAPFTTT